VLVGGVDLRDYRIASLRAAIALVGQNAFLFNDTVRANIRYGRLEASDADVRRRRAARPRVHPRAAPGYDT
jgi:ATP-binding cassette subfamily B protein